MNRRRFEIESSHSTYLLVNVIRVHPGPPDPHRSVSTGIEKFRIIRPAMKYQQTPTSRFSKASAWLQRDGSWHPFVSEPGVFYRVQGKVLQRVRFEDDEDEALLRLFDAVQPFPSRIFREGFREEVRFITEDDHYLLTDVLIRAYIGWDTLAQAAESFGIRMSFSGGNSLHCSIALRIWSGDSIMRTLILGRAFTTVAAQLARDSYEGIPHTVGEVIGLLRSANDFFMEELYQPPDKSGSSGGRMLEQEELF
jgi:hypothetical protein